MTGAEEYLWDRSAPVDRDVAALESALGAFRQLPPSFNIAAAYNARAQRRRFRRILRIAAVAAALLVAAGSLTLVRAPVPWDVETIAGVPRIHGAGTAEGSRARTSIAPGMVVETDGISRARFVIGRNGIADVLPASRVRILRADANEQRFSLEQGVLSAELSGASGAFVLETPFAPAVRTSGDACEFVIRVDSTGAGRVGVSHGTLIGERDGRPVRLPAGNDASLGDERGMGLPISHDATDRFKRLVSDIDSLGTSAERVAALLAVADRTSTITLFHLLPRVAGDERLQVVDRLAAFVPPPPGVTRDGLAQLDSSMLARWEPALRQTWEGPPPHALRRWWNQLRLALE